MGQRESFANDLWITRWRCPVALCRHIFFGASHIATVAFPLHFIMWLRFLDHHGSYVTTNVTNTYYNTWQSFLGIADKIIIGLLF